MMYSSSFIKVRKNIFINPTYQLYSTGVLLLPGKFNRASLFPNNKNNILALP